MSDLLTAAIFKNINISMNEIGDVIMFSDYPISSGVIEASGNIYIGDYTAIKQVPLPGSLLLFVSGIIMLASRKPC